jgi:hypothetical protein
MGTKALRQKVRAWVAVKKALLNDNDTFVKLRVDALATPDYLLKSDLKRFVDLLDPTIQHPDLAKHRPLKIGISISGGKHPGPGTIACFVRCRKTGKPMILGNHHVMLAEKGNSETGNPYIYQPAKNNGASEEDKIAIFDRGELTKNMDAAVAYIKKGLPFENRTPEGIVIKKPRKTAVMADEKVWKRGTTSIVTKGSVNEVNKNSTVPHARFGGDINFTKQIEVKSLVENQEFQIPGDSGSALIDENNHIIGLMHGGGKGGGLATPIQVVFDALEVDFWE